MPAPSATPSRLAVCALVLMVGAAAFAQAGLRDDEVARVEAGLQAADAAAVLDGSAARVEIVLFGQGSTYRRAQAAHVLRDFFRRYPPERVALPERASSDDGRTAIGRYWTQEGGAPLTVRVLHRAVGSGWQLASIRVERPSLIRSAER
ncbi:MAG TPA: DUF4783 domain-containing protein [Rubricoccaceae bacterium]